MTDFGFLPATSIGAGVAGLVMAWLMYRFVKSHSPGNDLMQELGSAIHDGAMTFLRREYTALIPFLAIVAALLAWLISWQTAVAYLGGGAFPGLYQRLTAKADGRTVGDY